MRMNGKVALVASVSAVAFLAACSDSPTAPSAATRATKASFAVGDTPAPTPAPVLGSIVVCKTGDVGGSFDVTRTAVGASTGTVSGLNTLIATGTCYEVANDQGGDQVGSNVTIDEDAVSGVTQTVTSCTFLAAGGSPVPCAPFTDGSTVFLNSFHAYVITYNNSQPPVTGCTFTKGWYQSKNATLTGVDGLTIDMEAAFFAATPNKTGSVSFVGPNNLLNLYQQYLAALENGGAAGPQAVQDAITAVGAGTTVSGAGQLTTTLTNSQIDAYIVTLSAFNEGTLVGWPHC